MLMGDLVISLQRENLPKYHQNNCAMCLQYKYFTGIYYENRIKKSNSRSYIKCQ